MAKRRKRKLKIKKIIGLLLVLVLIVSLGLCLIYKDKILLKIDSYRYGYDEEAILTFKENSIYDYVIKNNVHSKTLEKILNNDYYNDKYLKEYIKIDYNTKDNNFLENISELLSNGYKAEEINNLYSKLNIDSIETISNNEKDSRINEYIDMDFFNEEYLNRYINYAAKNTEYDSKQVVTYVNIGLDNEYYTNVIDVSNENDLAVLVNKYNKLSSNYEPDDLTIISSNYSYGTQKMKKEATEAFEEMCKAIAKDGLKLYATSAYRSYNTQNTLYNNYVVRDGKKEADTYSARPGYSEHQTGLAVDVGGSSSSIFVNSDEYQWMIKNSHKYGFILRYPEGKEFITGYMFESWHYRYLGVETATYIYDNNLTYEEYMAQK